MDQPQDILAVIERLREIIPLRNIVNPTDIIPSTPSTAEHPILPPSIQPLPPAALTLPDGPPPPPTSPLDHISTLLQTHILPYLNLSSLSPSYYGFVTGGATPAALLADWVTSYYDQNVQVHLPCETIATSVETAALNLLIDLFRLPTDQWGIGTGRGGGTFTTGATASNVLGLALGREWVVQERARRNSENNSTTSSSTTSPNGIRDEKSRTSIGASGLLPACRAAGVSDIQILSTLPHSSIAKAASIIGLGRSSVIPIGLVDDALAIDIPKLAELASTSMSTGTVYILAISTGEVNTGRFATDSASTMREVRRICDDHGIWIHVDAAFGLFARALMDDTNNSDAIADEYHRLVAGVQGLELADSITGDGHKLLNVPYDCGISFTRHRTLSEAVFQNGNAAYLNPAGAAAGDSFDGVTVQSPLNVGIENSRRFRALPVYATLMAYGRAGYVDMLRRQIGLARRVVRWMWTVDGLVVLPRGSVDVEEAVERTFMVVLFRAKDEEVNDQLVKKINASGKMYVSGTVWEGEKAARIAVSNWRVDVKRDGDLIEQVVESCL